MDKLSLRKICYKLWNIAKKKSKKSKDDLNTETWHAELEGLVLSSDVQYWFGIGIWWNSLIPGLRYIWNLPENQMQKRSSFWNLGNTMRKKNPHALSQQYSWNIYYEERKMYFSHLMI